MVREVSMEKMRNSVDVVLILENSREFPNDPLVQFFLHDRSFPEWKLLCENARRCVSASRTYG
jgi:hypothetical protein